MRYRPGMTAYILLNKHINSVLIIDYETTSQGILYECMNEQSSTHFSGKIYERDLYPTYQSAVNNSHSKKN